MVNTDSKIVSIEKSPLIMGADSNLKTVNAASYRKYYVYRYVYKWKKVRGKWKKVRYIKRYVKYRKVDQGLFAFGDPCPKKSSCLLPVECYSGCPARLGCAADTRDGQAGNGSWSRVIKDSRVFGRSDSGRLWQPDREEWKPLGFPSVFGCEESQNNQANSATEESVESLGIKHESLILAQNERWRRA